MLKGFCLDLREFKTKRLCAGASGLFVRLLVSVLCCARDNGECLPLRE